MSSLSVCNLRRINLTCLYYQKIGETFAFLSPFSFMVPFKVLVFNPCTCDVAKETAISIGSSANKTEVITLANHNKGTTQWTNQKSKQIRHVSEKSSAAQTLFTWREQDPRWRNNFSFGLHGEITVGVVTKKRSKKEKKREKRKEEKFSRWMPGYHHVRFCFVLFFLSLVLGPSEL